MLVPWAVGVDGDDGGSTVTDGGSGGKAEVENRL